MFDKTQTITVDGVVTRFDWLNPHTWLYISTTDKSGNETSWALEGAGVGWMTGSGWSPETVRPGDRVIIDFHPMKDGSSGGQLLNITLPDGKELCSGQGCDEISGVDA